MSKLSVFQNDCLRIMAGKRRIGKTKIVDLKFTLGVKMVIFDMIKRRRMNFERRNQNINYMHKAYKRDFKQKIPSRTSP